MTVEGGALTLSLSQRSSLFQTSLINCNMDIEGLSDNRNTPRRKERIESLSWLAKILKYKKEKDIASHDIGFYFPQQEL